MTPEQIKQVEEVEEIRGRHHAADCIRARGDAHILTPMEFTEAHVDRQYLLWMVDDLRKQLPKQYTEAELIDKFHRDCGDAALTMTPFQWFARFMEAIKE